MSVLADSLRKDFSRHRPLVAPSLRGIVTLFLTTPGYTATTFLRFQQFWARRRVTFLLGITRSVCHALTGADFVPGCKVGDGLLLPHPNGVVVGNGVRIGDDCTILQQVTLGDKYADSRADHRYPVIGDRVMIGAGAKVIGYMNVGDDSCIGANSVVTRDVLAGSTVVGIPARRID